MNEVLLNPLFSHLSLRRYDSVLSCFEKRLIKKGEKIDLKSWNAFSIVRNGSLRTEGVLEKGENLFLSDSSYFGTLPLSAAESRGVIRAVSDVEILNADPSALGKALYSSYPALKGYLRLLNLSGLPAAPHVEGISSSVPLVISAVDAGKFRKSAETAVLIARFLSEQSSTVIVELSREGVSAFDVCGVKITPPISEKKMGEGVDSDIGKLITEKMPNLHLLNVSFGSKVRTNPSIISPLISYLAAKYSYIVIHTGAQSQEIIEESSFVSDRVVFCSGTRKEYEKHRTLYPKTAGQGQSVYALFSGSAEKHMKSRGRVYSMPDIPSDIDDIPSFAEWGISVKFNEFVRALSARKTMLFIENTGYASLGFAGLVEYLNKRTNDNLALYAPSYALHLCTLYHQNPSLYMKNIKKLFKDATLLSMLDIRFPGECLLSNKSLRSFSSAYSAGSFLEESGLEISTSFFDGGSRTVSSCGSCRDFSAAVLCEKPFFEPFKTRKGGFSLSSDDGSLHPSFFLSRGFDRVIPVRIVSGGTVYPRGGAEYLFLAGLGRDVSPDRKKWISGDNIIIDAETLKCNIKRTVFDVYNRWDCLDKPLA
jgi:hypothetical protein